MAKISSMKSIPKVITVAKKKSEEDIKGNVIILDNIQDPGNLGTIIRSMVAFGFETLIISDDSVDLYNEKVIRSTEGMIFKINILRRNLYEIIPSLKPRYKIVGTDVVNGIDARCDKNKNIAIIIGNEGKGIKKEIKNLCDYNYYISMSKECESLNAGVAASIIMHDLGGRYE